MTRSLAGEYVGFEAIDDGEWALYFGPTQAALGASQIAVASSSSLRSTRMTAPIHDRAGWNQCAAMASRWGACNGP
jgi:hypothetical protein